MKRPSGMHPIAFASWILATYRAKLDPDRITQTEGTKVAASAGTHARDGWVEVGGINYHYSAAFDVRTRDLTREQEARLLSECYKVDIVGWHRTPLAGVWPEHCHLIFLGCEMKTSLQRQVHDWFNGLDGLAGHNREAHAPCSDGTIEHARATFLRFNPHP